MENVCWDCKHNCLKLKILVPHDGTIKECMRNTSNFQSDIAAVVKEKREDCTVTYRQDGEMRIVTFKLMHICDLKLENPNSDADCPRHCQKEDECVISNIIYSKLPSPQEPATELIPALDPEPFLPIEQE